MNIVAEIKINMGGFVLKKNYFVRSVSSVVVGSLVLGAFTLPAGNVRAEAPTADDLLISEYIEGSSFNKALELYNGTGSDLDLSAFTLETYFNGKAVDPAELQLEGTLKAGEVYVIAHAQAGKEIMNVADTTNSQVANFNGDDVIVLKKNGEVIDSIGQIGSTDKYALDVTLTRKTDSLAGDVNPDDAFDTSTSFKSLPKDTFTHLGKYPDDADSGDPEDPAALTSIADARTNDIGTAVKVQGVVTAMFEAGGQTNAYIQDDTAGIIVRASGLKANVGDEITAEGKFASYYGMAQIETGGDKVVVTTPAKGVPAPQVVQAADFQAESGEAIEGEFVQVDDIEVTGENDRGDFIAEDDSGEFLISPATALALESGKTYERLQGVVNYSFDEYRLVPRDEGDIIEKLFSVTASPGSGTVSTGTKVTLQTAQPDAAIHYTLDGTSPSADSKAYEGPIELTEDTVVKAVVVKEDGETSEVSTFSYDVLDVEDIAIHDIQGEAHSSPYEGVNVSSVGGIVTALDGTNGFYMQEPDPDDNDATSEGIYVYAKGSGVKVGDEVSVNGEVKEWREDGYDDAADLLTTQITSTSVAVQSSGNDLPAAIVLGEDRIPPTVTIKEGDAFDPDKNGLDFYESLEGMRVELKDATVTGPPKYDELPVYVNTNDDQLFTNAGGLLASPEDYNPERIQLDVDGLDVNAKVGDKLDGSVTGVVSYDYSNFKIRLTSDFPEIIDGGTKRETTKLENVEDELNIASYNVENFSASTDQDKVNKIAESINANLKQPDIIGLVEVQDNNGAEDDGTVEADESYQKLIDAIKADGGPEYAFTDIAPVNKQDGGQPGGNIRVGFLYNPDRVTMTDKKDGDAETAVEVSEDGLSLNPGRVDPLNEAFEDSRKSLAAEFEFQGEKVIVVANHFNSKGGDDALFGANHPVELGSEVQRMKQAAVLNGFVQDVIDNVDDANVVVLGDLNDFEFSKPLETLKGDILTNMTEMLPITERYSYNYQGNAQVLDHILVSNNLAKLAEIDSVNINSNFSEADGRASDHDPMLAQLEFGTQVERVSGEDRYKTAIEVSKQGWEEADTVVIARGDSFPDALAGAPLAFKEDAPILLTKSKRLSAEVKAEIERLGAKKAIILGGTGAVSDYVGYQLKGEGLSVERIKGADRYETAANIAARLDGSPDKAVIADGRNYPDALSAASYAAANGYPILLTKTDKLPAETKRALSGMEETIVLGGTAAVSEEILKKLPNATRYSGATRYDTSAEIAGKLFGKTNHAFVATGADFADALTGSVLAAKENAPMLLVQKQQIPESIEQVIEEQDYSQYHILGGTNAVSDDVMDDLKE